ncbi:MAG: hypothetical protein OEQ53_07715 [Saprospiraceae bacterium]|nr:hypothetical protein [Saprospiraceae bacterium]
MEHLEERTYQKCACRTHRIIPLERYSWLPAILLAVLPKCPLCIFSYSSAITLCSGRTLYDSASFSGLPIFVCLAALVILTFVINWRGRRTLIALSLAAIGILLLAASIFFQGISASFYFGVVTLMVGCFANANLMYFLSRFAPGKISWWV